MPRMRGVAVTGDPVEVATAAVRELRYKGLTPTRRRPHFEDVVVAETILAALHDAGWRIVRDTCDCGEPGCSPFGVDEWLPGTSSDAEAPPQEEADRG